jgi:hypothetical protein
MNPIVDAIRRVREAEAAGDSDATVTIDHQSDDAKWMQILPDRINVGYPFAEPPLERLRAIGISHADKLELVTWEAGLFADLRHRALSDSELASFASSYLTMVFGLDENNAEAFNVNGGSAMRGHIEFDDPKQALRQFARIKRALG